MFLSKGITVIIITLLISALIGGFCWKYTLNTWLEFFDKDIKIEFWQGALIGFCPIVGQASIPAAVTTFILMLFLT